jgi:hypothetical protein
MNTSDMHTREKINRLHLAEMHREARERSLLRDLSPVRFPPGPRRRTRRVLIGIVLVLLAGIFLITATVFLILQSPG